jgi:hypothetical protein
MSADDGTASIFYFFANGGNENVAVIKGIDSHSSDPYLLALRAVHIFLLCTKVKNVLLKQR